MAGAKKRPKIRGKGNKTTQATGEAGLQKGEMEQRGKSKKPKRGAKNEEPKETEERLPTYVKKTGTKTERVREMRGGQGKG